MGCGDSGEEASRGSARGEGCDGGNRRVEAGAVLHCKTSNENLSDN